MKYFLVKSPYRNDSEKLLQQAVCSILDEYAACVEAAENAEVIVPIGGDGTMLHSIRQFYHLNKPFIGINGGTRGFLMNRLLDDEDIAHVLENDVNFLDLWLLEGEIFSDDGSSKVYGFNDIWVERSGGQTLRMFLTIDKRPTSEMITGDGMLFSTPQGSTGYNLALRGKLILPEVPVLQVTPIAAVINKNPLGSIILSDNSEIHVSFDKLSQRPGRIFVDGMLQDIQNFNAIRIRKSDRKVTLGFRQQEDFISKMASWQIG